MALSPLAKIKEMLRRKKANNDNILDCGVGGGRDKGKMKEGGCGSSHMLCSCSLKVLKNRSINAHWKRFNRQNILQDLPHFNFSKKEAGYIIPVSSVSKAEKRRDTKVQEKITLITLRARCKKECILTSRGGRTRAQNFRNCLGKEGRPSSSCKVIRELRSTKWLDTSRGSPFDPLSEWFWIYRRWFSFRSFFFCYYTY